MSKSDQPALPRLPVSLLRATAPWKRSAAAATTLPTTESSVTGWRPDRRRLAEYRALVGSGSELPMAYPQVPIMAMHMDLLSRWSFPVRAVGLVHLRLPFEVFLGAHLGLLVLEVILLSEHEHHHVGVLLDGAGFAKVRQLRPLVVARLDLTREL